MKHKIYTKNEFSQDNFNENGKKGKTKRGPN
jgi:hypothetical protein